ncbi:MAG: hypothetical protein Q4D05_04175 [Acinetobacter sp.]|nr:hypothetical protein [Acinetobacter sp.]
MNKWKYTVFAFVVTALLAGCQSISSVSPTLNHLRTTATVKNVNVFCRGAMSCQFTRLNEIQIADHKTGWITPQAVLQGIIRLQGVSSLLENQRVPFYLSVPAEKNEIAMQFYPISKYKAETLSIIHDFKAGHDYSFEMFRQRDQADESLLDSSTPKPLCVNLRQDQVVIRRFCRPHDALTGVSEFVEQKVNDQGK